MGNPSTSLDDAGPRTELTINHHRQIVVHLAVYNIFTDERTKEKWLKGQQGPESIATRLENMDIGSAIDDDLSVRGSTASSIDSVIEKEPGMTTPTISEQKYD